MAGLNFDARNVDPKDSFDPIPAGWYNGRIDASEMKPTKDGQGQYLELRIRIIDGQHANRVIFDRLNLKNKNPIAEELAAKTLSQICHAIGVLQVQQSEQLHNIPFKFRVKIDSREGYDPSNAITGYDGINSVRGKPTSPTPVQQQQQQTVPRQAAITQPTYSQPVQAAPQAQYGAPPQGEQPAPAPEETDIPSWARRQA